MDGPSSNFAFLSAPDVRLARLGALAERYFCDDAPAALIELRQFAAFIAKEIARAAAVWFRRSYRGDPIRAQRAAAPWPKRGRRTKEAADA